jgi:deoxycytidylate deaminase
MELASLAAQRSNCMKRRVGCVLVRERRVISTGYNGTPRGMKNCGEGGCELKSSVSKVGHLCMGVQVQDATTVREQEWA